MTGRRFLLLAALVAALLLTAAHASGTRTQLAGLTLQAVQQDVTAADGTTSVLVTVTFGGPAGQQVRLIQDRAVLLFDGFADGTPGSVTVTFPHACGQTHVFMLYGILNGAVADTRTATLTLCPQQAPAQTPTPVPTPGAAAQPAPPRTATPAPPPPPPPPAAPAAPPAPAAAAPAAGVLPGQPSVPAPPLEPPSVALDDGFVLADPDDATAAEAIAAGVPLVRVLAIWLRGTDSSGAGAGSYQYVEIANLGGASQDMSGWALQASSGTMSGLTFYFPDGFGLDPGDSCRIYVAHPAEATCTNGSFALYQFWGDHGSASLWDAQGDEVDELDY